MGQGGGLAHLKVKPGLVLLVGGPAPQHGVHLIDEHDARLQLAGEGEHRRHQFLCLPEPLRCRPHPAAFNCMTFAAFATVRSKAGGCFLKHPVQTVLFDVGANSEGGKMG